MAINNFRKADICLDSANDYIFDEQFAKVFDNRGRDIVVQITDNGVIRDQSELVLTLAWRHDQRGNEGLTRFTALDSKQGLFSVAIDNAMLIQGTVTMCIQIIDGKRLTNSRNFKMRVEGNPLDVDKVVAEDSFTLFIEALDELNKYDDRVANLELLQSNLFMKVLEVEEIQTLRLRGLSKSSAPVKYTNEKQVNDAFNPRSQGLRIQNVSQIVIKKVSGEE